MNQEKATRKFGIRDKFGYALGDFSNDLTFVLSALFLLKFYTDIMGVSAVLVGAMMMIARIIDAFADVTMGQIVDRSKPTNKGKFAPWLRRMCAPVAVASILIFATWFQNMPMGFKIFWMFFSYILWGICYSGINIPYGSMASAISSEPKDRTILSNWRTIGSATGTAIIGVVLPMFVYYKDKSGKTLLSAPKLSVAAIICSAAAIVGYLVCYCMTTERVKLEQKTDKFSLKELFETLAHNRSLIGVIVSALFLLLAQLSLGNMGAYVYPNYFGNAAALSMATLLGTLLTFALAPFTVRLADALGKKEMVIASSMISIVSLLTAFIIHTHNVSVFIALVLLGNVGISIFALVCWAMITDVIDDIELKTHERSDGTIYSVYSFARKLGQACSAGITGVLLTAVGYTSATAFNKNVVDGIYNITCLVPVIAFIFVILFLWLLYPLNKNAVKENATKLHELYEKTSK